MRVSIVAHNDDLHPPSLAIVGEEVSCMNAYDTEAKIDVRPPRWKPAAAHWHNAGRISYRFVQSYPLRIIFRHHFFLC